MEILRADRADADRAVAARPASSAITDDAAPSLAPEGSATASDPAKEPKKDGNDDHGKKDDDGQWRQRTTATSHGDKSQARGTAGRHDQGAACEGPRPPRWRQTRPAPTNSTVVANPTRATANRAAAGGKGHKGGGGKADKGDDAKKHSGKHDK